MNPLSIVVPRPAAVCYVWRMMCSKPSMGVAREESLWVSSSQTRLFFERDKRLTQMAFPMMKYEPECRDKGVYYGMRIDAHL